MFNHCQFDALPTLAPWTDSLMGLGLRLRGLGFRVQGLGEGLGGLRVKGSADATTWDLHIKLWRLDAYACSHGSAITSTHGLWVYSGGDGGWFRVFCTVENLRN